VGPSLKKKYPVAKIAHQDKLTHPFFVSWGPSKSPNDKGLRPGSLTHDDRGQAVLSLIKNADVVWRPFDEWMICNVTDEGLVLTPECVPHFSQDPIMPAEFVLTKFCRGDETLNGEQQVRQAN
jgi:hypothetical protein